MNFLESNKMLDGHGIFEKKLESHSFACQNKKMIEYGLSVFSKSSLNKWLEYDYNKEKIKSVGGISLWQAGGAKDLDDAVNLITSNDKGNDPGANFNVWRNEGRSGRYIEFTSLGDWEYQKSSTEKYDWQDVVTNEEDEVGSHTGQGITCFLIKLNDFIQKKLLTEPTVEIDSNWTKNQIAAYEFFTDVNSSKERCLSWTSDFEFLKQSIKQIDTGAATTEKEYEEKTITLKLYFFGMSNTRKTERKIGLKSLNIVAPRKNAIGQEYIAKDEGKIYYATNQENPRSHAGASLDIKYNEFLNKWESGTPQAVAIMTTDLPAVQRPDLGVFTGGQTNEVLHHETGLEVLQGSAIPLSMDKCNPLQWCPSYNQDERYRNEEDRQKFELKVYNISNTTGFSSGDIVILNRIDGVWIPLPYASGNVETKSATSLGKWDFTYLMTNTDYFFRNEQDELLSFDSFEKGLHKAYYKEDNLNDNTYTSADTKFANVTNNYFQTTSWDFMGPTIGGLRKYGNALACTQFEFYPDGTRVGDSDNGREQYAISGPFFGCVFPNGYQEDQKVETLKADSKDFNIKPTGAKDATDTYHQFFDEILNTQNVFENENTNILASAKGGMFNHGNITQLPADIGVNASPEGTYGRPISLVRTLPTGITALKNDFKAYFANEESGVPKRYSWMYKHPLNTDLTDSDINSSAFDIKPVNIRKIQFRPLKTETYACYEIANKNDAELMSEERGEFARRMWDSQSTDDDNPISVDALNRNNIGENDLTDDNGLIYHGDVTTTRTLSDNNPDLIWDRNWIGTYRSNSNQGNAFGIIGAVCTATFSTKIEFVLDNYIGMTPWFLNGFLYPSWGRGSYNLPHSTQLWVRCFHSWPREQTIYDSRFFAVHHFNEGMDKQQYEDKRLDVQDQAEIDASGTILSVDFLEITSPNINKKVHSDTTPFTSGVATKRRGKLLPYKWAYKTLGIGSFSYLFDPDIPSPEIARDNNIFIKSSGENYNANDRFVLSGGAGEGVLLKPVVGGDNNGITKFEVLHPGYNFVKSDFLTKGTNLDLTTSSSISVSPSGSVAGQGLDAIIVGGTVVDSPEFIDEKPKEIFSQEITPAVQTEAGVNTITDGPRDSYRAFGEDLTETDRSSNNEYDLFFHFHNDISHTWDWDRSVLPPAFEQKLDMQINLDPDS